MVIEATYGWYWAVDLLQEPARSVHLAHPSGDELGQPAGQERRERRDAISRTCCVWVGCAEAWIAPPAVRELRELVRYRAKLVQLRSGLKAQVHAVMAKEGVLPDGDATCSARRATRQLDAMELGDAVTRVRVESLRDLIEVYDREVAMLERDIHQHLKRRSRLSGDPGDQRGRRTISAAIFVAEIGDVTRFPTPGASVLVGRAHAPASRVRPQDACAAGSPNRDRGWCAAALIEGISRYHGGPRPRRALPPDRRTARREQGPRRVGPQGSHARLLRPARRRDPLPRARRAAA